MMKNKLVVSILMIVISLFAFNSAKAILKEKTTKELTTEAEAIVLGKVISIRSYYNTKSEVLSDVLIENQLTVGKNWLTDKYITITVLGGVIGDLNIKVSDMPEFTIDENVMVFLKRKNQSYETVGLAQGKFTFVDDKILETGQDTEIFLDNVFTVLEEQTAESFQNQRYESKQLVSRLKVEQLIYPSKNDLLNSPTQLLNQCTQPAGYKWNATNIGYTVGSDIPWTWIQPLARGASAWNQAGSRFRFVAGNNSNIISFKNFGANNSIIALTTTSYNSSGIISRVITQFNSALSFSVVGESNKYDVQNIMAHEFGHWLHLKDIYTDSCRAVTMYGRANYGTTYQRTLEPADQEGIVAIYGR